uniref:CAAX prenyl protease 2/Lysostaphin resistance protein A-like domain-containing protein n=1 Tax=Guillardia theta TaxID=55529 RepID=A0A7S4NY07_GUITH
MAAASWAAASPAKPSSSPRTIISPALSSSLLQRSWSSQASSLSLLSPSSPSSSPMFHIADLAFLLAPAAFSHSPCKHLPGIRANNRCSRSSPVPSCFKRIRRGRSLVGGARCNVKPEDSEKGAAYFSAEVMESGNLFLAWSLLRNQALLGVTSLFTIQTLQYEDTITALGNAGVGILPLILIVLGSFPILFLGNKISTSESKAFIDINFSTNILALKLFGSKENIPFAFGVSSVLGAITGLCEELSFRALGLPILAKRLGEAGDPNVLLGLLASSLVFGLAHWSIGGSWKDNSVVVPLQILTGLWFGVLYILSGYNFLVPAGVHAIYDAYTLIDAHLASTSQLKV